MRQIENYPSWAVEATLATGDTTKQLKAAPGAGKTLIVTTLRVRVLVSAAQAITIGSTTTKVCKLAASEAVSVESFTGPLDVGLPLDVNDALVITPAAAGPSLHVVAEGYTR